MADFAKSIVIDFWASVAEMSPYLLFGFFVAGILSVFVSQHIVERHLGGKGLSPVVKASLFGVPLPLCSCGVIPVSMSLHKHGASKASAISFLLSTPQTGADSILVTLSLLGPLFAIFRPVAAFVTGIIGGTLVNVFDKKQDDKEPKSQECTEECCCGSQDKKIVRGLKYGFVTLPADIGRAMLAGLVIAAVISALVPDGYFAERLGTGIFAMVVMMFLGIPVYVCATASVPVAAALILKGLTPGAAIVFLMTGPATNAASLVTIWKTLGSKTAIIYLLTVAGCALLSGILLDYIAVGVDFEVASRPAAMLPATLKYSCAIVLITILAAGAISKKKNRN
ncbi:MAG: SO_0444 family Cu/Zn efflux transporter [Sedimentisphaerales bacterium]|nr:SO_0444 family Cu/Zn efflux transporter [Sedimentisphaerales bacterium]